MVKSEELIVKTEMRNFHYGKQYILPPFGLKNPSRQNISFESKSKTDC